MESLQNLSFYQCLTLLDLCAKHKVIQTDPDPDRKSNLLIYREKGTVEPEGWYSENIFTVANELLEDREGQQLLIKSLSDKGITFDCQRLPFGAEKLM